jgi:hypothetical protein
MRNQDESNKKVGTRSLKDLDEWEDATINIEQGIIKREEGTIQGLVTQVSDDDGLE